VVLLHGITKSLTAIQLRQAQPRELEIHATRPYMRQQFFDDGAILGAALSQAQNTFGPRR
jgi:hypothetical protein